MRNLRRRHGHNCEASTASRYDELKRMLEERQREIMHEVQGKMRDVRAEGAGQQAHTRSSTPGESSEVDIQEDIEFALIQMKAETLNKINEALRGSKRATTATASSAARRSPSRGCARCPSRSAARTVRRPARTPQQRERHLNARRGRRRPCSRHVRARRPALRLRRWRGPRSLLHRRPPRSRPAFTLK